MKRFLRTNGLALGFGLLFLGSLLGQAFAGNTDLNNRRLVDGGDPIGLWQYVSSSDFAVDVAENWQSEYLQFFLFIFATVWLMQRGSNESKPAKRLGPESDEQQYLGAHAKPNSPPWARAGGWRTQLYSNSLGLVMLVLFVGSWLAQSIAGRSAFNNEQLIDFQDPVSWWDYVLSADFWNRSLQNWQSEFLAIGSMAIFSVYLRQRGSSESKPVGAPHDTTDESG
ncbi:MULTISPECIES: DUF6766 family protein [unclassified Saccharothrix]|uniref:DUF6766 family protein n=1 Tax=unclassified Saccharothrix TaxID=2593673 RepID=UPI00307D958A